MTERTLTITSDPDWQSALRVASRQAQADTYQGETLNFERPGDFFGRLTERRWALVRLLQGQGEKAVRGLARRARRDAKRVHEDVAALAGLDLVERTADADVVCRFASIHIDMRLQAAA